MADQTINGLGPNITPLGTDVLPTGKGGINPDLKTSLTQIAEFSQSNFANLSREIYISNSQPGTGTGTAENPFKNGDDAIAIGLPGSKLIFDFGSYILSDFANKGFVIQGRGKYGTKLIVSNITLENTSWQATSNPSMGFLGLSTNATITLTASAEKSGSSVIVDDVIAPSFTAAKMGAVTIGDRCEIDAQSGVNCASFISINNRASTSISCQSDGSAVRVFEVNNTATPTINITNPSSNAIRTRLCGLSAINASGKIYQDLILDLGTLASVDLWMDAESVSVNPITDVNNVSVEVKFLTDAGLGISTFKGLGIGYDLTNVGSYGTFAGINRGGNPTPGTDPTLFCSRGGGNGIPPEARNSVFLGTAFEMPGVVYNEVFLASSYSGQLISERDDVFAVSYGTGYGFGRTPKANLDVKKGAKGDAVFSADAEVADADIDNGALNPYISGDVLIHKYKNSSGVVRKVAQGPTITITAGVNNLVSNTNYILDRASLAGCGLPAMAIGDIITVYIANVGQAQFGTVNPYEIHYFDKATSGISITYVRTTQQYQFVTFTCIASGVIVVASSNGDLLFDGGARQNCLGTNATLYGNAKADLSFSVPNQLKWVTKENAPPFYTTTGVISAADIYNCNVIFDPAGANEEFTLPSASAIESIISAKYGTSISIDDTFWVNLVNRSSADSITIKASSDFTILNGDFLILPKDNDINIFKKVSVSPLGYAIVG